MSDQDEWDRMTQATDPPAVFWPFRRPPTLLDMEAPHVSVYLAVHPTKGIFWAGIDRNEAHKQARAMGSLVARIPVVGDYRVQVDDCACGEPMTWLNGGIEP